MIKFVYSISLILCYLFLGFVCWGDHILMTPLFAIYCFFLAFFSKKFDYVSFKNKFHFYIPVFVWVFFSTVIDVVGVLNGYNPYPLSFTYYILPPLFFYLGVQFFSKKRIDIILASIFLLYFNHFYLFPNAFAFFNTNELSNSVEFPEIKFLNKNGEEVKLKNDKIIVLDFWSTFCGVCYDKFPQFEALNKRYLYNPNITFYAVHVSYKNDKFNNTIKLLDDYDYKFKKIYAIDEEEIKTKLGIKLFPTLMIIKNGKIIYRGALITNKNVIFDNTITRIEKLLKE